MQVGSFLVFAVLGYALYRLALWGGALSSDGLGGQRITVGVNDLGLVALAAGSLVGIVVLHELVHGLAMRACGAHPQYGVLWMRAMVYATARGYRFPRNAYIVVALAPLALSVLAAAAMLLVGSTAGAVILGLCAALNGSGALGDLWLVSIVLRYPPAARVVDERDGIRVYMPS